MTISVVVAGAGDPHALTPDELALAQLIVNTLGLETPATDVAPDAPLFSEGLGLDSIDILEISLAISKKYGVQIRADGADNLTIFRSLRNLSGYIQQRRKP